MIKYDFIRMLAKALPKEDLEELFMLASEKKVELYYKTSQESYETAKTSSDFAGGNVYISAADWEFMVSVLKNAGVKGELCDAKQAKVEETPVEKAEREYYRKRRIGQLECLAVLVIVLLVLLVKSL